MESHSASFNINSIDNVTNPISIFNTNNSNYDINNNGGNISNISMNNRSSVRYML